MYDDSKSQTVIIPLRSNVIEMLDICSMFTRSLWYLNFYCNPRIQSAVVGKILMDGFGAAGALYGTYIEKYMHTESPVLIPPPPKDFVEEEKSWTY